MSVTTTDISKLQAYVQPLLGQKAWGVLLGHGSFITLEFGKSLVRPSEKKVHGEWHLWIYCCAWRLEKGDRVLAGSEDPRSKLEQAVQQLEGLVLNSVELLSPAWDTLFKFEDQVVLRLFPLLSEEAEHWMLYMPDGVLSVGPGTDWSFEAV
ncbi:hypothetical protein ACKFKF_10775 [Phormidesmis sp. 146-12]